MRELRRRVRVGRAVPMDRVLKSLIYGGLIAGTVDIGAATLINAVNPLIILQAIASGLLGRQAFQGGAGVMLLGLVLQWGMSVVIAALFNVAANMWPVLARRWIMWGTLYGVVVFIIMNYVVVPLSAASYKWSHPLSWFVENGLAMLVFGWIVAFTANRFLASSAFGATGSERA
jgi:uncharacterized membrane protein YagU involved in acid resistance